MKLPSLVATVFMLVLISSAFVFPTNTLATNASADKATLEAIARGYLQGKAAAVGVGGKIPDILLSSVKEGPSFYVTRFVQTYNSLRVFNTSASVMISKSGLLAVDGATSFKSWDRVVDASIDSQAALKAATAAIAEKVTLRGSPKTEKVIYVREASTPRLSATGQSIVLHDAETAPQVAGICWQVNVPTLEPLGDWLVLVDGTSGKAILKQDLTRHDSGSGWVYQYSNPVQTGGNLAWPAPDDLDHGIITQQETNMQLLHLASGTGKLVGDFVDLTAPGIIGAYKSAGLADNVTRYYHYTRSNDAFEEVMVYYYVDSVHSYLQQIGEGGLLNYPVPAHAHYYAVANAFWDFDGLHFGDGTLSYPIDTAEDADVIIHEYGHAIHGDEGLFNGWVSEEMGAFSEGFSDYLAASFLDQGAPGTLGCLSEWFGYGLGYPGGTYPYCMRNTFSTKHYPEDKTGEVHDDGEMWSAALWRLRTSLGKGVVDRLAIEMGYYLWSSASFLDAVNAIIQVDRVIYAGAYESTIRQVFRDNGMFSYSVRTDTYPWSPFWSSPIDIPVANKGFERGSFGPEWGVDYNDPAYTPQVQSSIQYAGTYAAELVGSSSGSSSYSAIYYEFSMPSTATWVRLRFHYLIDTSDDVNYDWFEWRLGTPSWYWYDRWLADTGGGWNTYQTSIWVNALQGQTCRLTFLLHDDGATGDPTYVYIDGSGGSGYWDDIFLQWSDFHASITLNGVSHDTPPETEIRVLDGATVSLSAPSETIVGGLTYRFMQWWDRVNGQWFSGGVNAAHPSFAPTSDIYLEADYTQGWEVAFTSYWLRSQVTLDGGMTSPTEWSDAVPQNLTLPEWGNGPSAVSAKWWMKNDATWLYILERVTWSGPTSAKSDGDISYYWDWWNGTWPHSDMGGVNFDRTTFDLHGWDETTWYSDPVNNVQGAATYDGTYYWFEFRKALNSTDGYDWTFVPGGTYGAHPASLMVGFYDESAGTWYGTNILLHLEPEPEAELLEFGPTASGVLNAPARTVYFIFPDGDAAHPKPPGVGYAALSDWTALGFMYGSLANMPQIIALDTNSTYVDPATGAPRIHNSIIVLFAGPLVNSVVHYYEQNRIAPLWWSLQGGWSTGTMYYRTRSGAVAATMTVQTANSGSADMALLEAFTDANGNTVIICLGFGGRGTFAGGVYFKTVLSQYGNLAGLTDSWYFYSWTDRNGNLFAEPSEVGPIPYNHGN